ncbi:MAG: acyl-CoA thioesterase II [Acidimicrobiales bacterium]|nr:acyl-CoA thioesterase II [Acidimicrobiales bacterium]
MQSALDDLVALLDLEAIEVNHFRGTQPNEDRQRVFGGQVAGQALVAAARTVDAGHVHSLHGYFLRPGDPGIPILYEVDRIRDGRSFTTRRVVAIQHGRAIFNLQASFHVDEEGFEYQAPFPPGVPDPESLPDFKTRMAPWAERLGPWYHRPRPIDTRDVDFVPPHDHTPQPPHQRVWLRAAGRLPDDPVLHTCVLTYASDLTLLDTTLMPHGMTHSWDEIIGASLDHAMWFHRPFRADEWLLYDQFVASTSGGRGLAYGSVFAQDGTMVASVVQEGLIRPLRPRP